MSTSLLKSSLLTHPNPTVGPFAQHVFWRLVWKEARQVVPLLVVLLAVGLLLHLLVLISASASRGGSHHMLIVLVPSLFAVGAGAVLVSQDKEQRTIGWLNSLPIGAGTILRTKLVVGIIGLLVMWLASVAIAAFTTDLSTLSLSSQPNGQPVFIWPLNSFFLLFLGFATAWRFQSVLVALVMILPLALLPTIMTFIESELLSRGDFPPDWLIALNYSIASLIAVWYGWRSGKAYLTAQHSVLRWKPFWVGADIRALRQSSLPKVTQGLAPTLVWQFAWQNRLVPIAIIANLAILAIAFVLMLTGTKYQDPLILPSIAGWLIASWLATSVFQSDSLQNRIRFLAERGIAPSTIWWTRQILPASIFAFTSVLIALFSWLNPFFIGQQQPPYPIYAVVVFLAFAIYAAGQWYGQVCRSPIVSMVTAPAAMALAVGYLVFALDSLGSPLWLLIVSLGIAFLATRVMTHPWMDGRTGFQYWLGHAGFMVFAAGLPAIPFFITAATFPSITASEYREFVNQFNRQHGQRVQPISLVAPARNQEFSEIDDSMGMGFGLPGDSSAIEPPDGLPETVLNSVKADEELLGFADQVRSRIEAYEKQLAESSAPVMYSDAVHFVVAEAMLTRLNLDENPKAPVYLERYRTSMRILDQMVKRMRLSWRLLDQEGADRMECWMLEQMQAKDAREILGQSLYATIVRSLADKEGRKQARKRAIALSWGPNHQLTLGGIVIPTSKLDGQLRQTLANHRQTSRLSWLLMQYLNSNDQSQADDRYTALSDAWGYAGARRISHVGLGTIHSIRVGEAWMGKWESDAQELSKE